MKRVNSIIQADLYRYFGEEGKNQARKGFSIPGFKYTYCLRQIQHCTENRNVFSSLFRFLWGVLLRYYRYKYGFDIPACTSIGPGLYIGHFGHITISSEAQLGSNVNIAPGVVIGVTRASTCFSRPGAPTIGDRVWIGSNAIVVGNISIGNDVLIAPGAYVYFDVPSLSMVRGNPGKIFKGDIGSRGYINRTIGFSE